MPAAIQGKSFWGVFLVFCVTIVYALLRVVPHFEHIFAEMLNDKPLPALTRGIIITSRWFSQYWWLVLFSTVLLLVIHRICFSSWLPKVHFRVGFWGVIGAFIVIFATIFVGLLLPMLMIIRAMNH